MAHRRVPAGSNRHLVGTFAVLALAAPIAAVSAGVTTAAGATGLTVTRVAGSDRYATAAAIADAGWPGALPANSTLLLATGSTFPMRWPVPQQRDTSASRCC